MQIAKGGVAQYQAHVLRVEFAHRRFAERANQPDGNDNGGQDHQRGPEIPGKFLSDGGME